METSHSWESSNVHEKEISKVAVFYTRRKPALHYGMRHAIPILELNLSKRRARTGQAGGGEMIALAVWSRTLLTKRMALVPPVPLAASGA